MNTIIRNVMLTIGLTVSAANSQAAIYQANIDINAGLYAANTLTAPFLLDFQLNSGGGVSPVTNTVTLSKFDFQGGSGHFGSATMLGNASGDLSSTVTLVDNASSSYNEFFQGFAAGVSHISFTIDTSTQLNNPAPDLFSVAILDSSTGYPQIPTNDPQGISLINLTLTDPIAISSYSGIGSAAGVNVTVAPVPVPGAMMLFASAMIGLVKIRRFKQ